jgi:hypothetical protein
MKVVGMTALADTRTPSTELPEGSVTVAGVTTRSAQFMSFMSAASQAAVVAAVIPPVGIRDAAARAAGSTFLASWALTK